MESDLFASLRKRDTGVSTSFAPAPPQHAQHDAAAADTRAEPQKSATKHLGHEKHDVDGRSREDCPAEPAPRVATVPDIRERDNDELPREWRLGLNRLNSMRMPSGATPDRWHQIVLDAHRFAWTWHAEAAEQGWSMGSLVGLDPRNPYQDEAGLIFSMRGNHVVSLFKDHCDRAVAAIKIEAGYQYHYRRDLDHLPLIWTLNSVDQRR